MTNRELGDKLSETYRIYTERFEHLDKFPCKCMAEDSELRRAVLDYSLAIKAWDAAGDPRWAGLHHAEWIARMKAAGFEVVE
jgi:hypothetical protein